MAFTPILVTRQYYEPDLSASAGTVTFTPTTPMVNEGTVVASPVVGTLDPTGQLSVLLAANDDVDTTPPDPWASYRVVEQLVGQARREYYVQIPADAAGGTIDLGGLLSASVPPVVTYPAPGPQGPAGADSTVPGPPGADGEDGVDGADGVGIPAGGTTGQYLRKSSGTDYESEWATSTAIEPAIVDAKGDLLVGTAADTVARLAVGANGRVPAAASGATPGIEWQANPTPAPVVLNEAALALDASAGKVFDVSLSANRTMPIPTGLVDGRAFLIRVRVPGGTARTLSLTTTGAGSFRFGTDVTGTTATVAGARDYIACVYDATADRVDVVGYDKGH